MVFDKVKAYCEAKKLSISAFEKLCGLSNGTVGKWQNGGFPSVMTLRKIAAATDTEISDWIDIEGGEK